MEKELIHSLMVILM
jgi:hypothetical protein